MATAKRRINSTNRKRIGHEAVDIRLLETPRGSPQKASAILQLERFEFPSSALVVIEAYRSSSLMRFECGTIGAPKIPPVMVLNEIDEGGNVQFRVKVVDLDGVVGKLLGSASRIRPISNDDDKGRRTLLPIKWSKTLGPELWEVTGDEDHPPALVLNLYATGLDNKIMSDPTLRGVIMPAAFRIVLEKLIALPQPDDDDEGDWKNDWLKFCQEELEVEEEPYELDSEQRRKWVSECVRAFAEKAGFLELVRTAHEGGKE